MPFATYEKSKENSTDIWLTPLELIKPLGEFDLDPCGMSFHNTANTIYTEGGLDKEWFGRVWLNPPYSETEKWVAKLAEHGRGVTLVYARVDTKWAQKLIPRASSIFFPKGRIKFLTEELKPKGSPGAPSMFLSFGEIPDWTKVREGISFKI